MDKTANETPDLLVVKRESPPHRVMDPLLPFVRTRNTRMRRLIDRARHAAIDNSPVLIGGERGVGKSTIAGMIHQWAHRDGPCVVLRGPSEQTPASREEARKLLAQATPGAAGGTLVFDEIGAFSLVQQRNIRGLLAGMEPGAQSPPCQAIMIAAITSSDLSAAAKNGTFREELLSLLMDESLHIPPLRERPEDITAMAEEMLAHFAARHHRPELTLEAEAKLALLRHTWPGNLHELRNTIERVVLTATTREIAESELRLRMIPESGCNRSGEFLSLDALEKQQILRVIRAAPTLEEAARILHVDISTLWRKRRRYGI